MTVISGTPAYIQVAASLRAKIESGKLRPGSRLPSHAELRKIHAVSNTVIRDAIKELRRDGLVVGQQGKGVFVAASLVRPACGASPPADLAARLAALEDSLDALDRAAQDLRSQVAGIRADVTALRAAAGPPPAEASRS